MSNKNLANALRFLAIDAVEQANSGHPGMPMGMADVASVLFNEFLKFNPKNPKWHDRDRFILSAGHGSMLLYGALYLSGYQDIKIEDIKKFRQLHSKCAGHPEFGELEGIETTTGPLGQGVANAVGMALSEKMLQARFGKKIFDHKIYALVGDGCLMEGISQEALALAGHLNLNNLILLWDDNSISIDGKTSIATSENMSLRFEALGFNVIAIDGHNFDEIRQALSQAQNSTKPILIACKTTIGFGSPSKAGSEKCHGSPLGKDEIQKTRENLNWNFAPFEIPNDILETWRKASNRCLGHYKISLENLQKLDETSRDLFAQILEKKLPTNFSQKLAEFKAKIINDKTTQASRKSSQQVLEFLTSNLPSLIGGSADLTESVLTKTSATKSISKDDFSGRYIHYGVREHAMGAIMNGLSLHGNFIPYGGTFLVFSDYLKPALRLSALMHQPIIYVFTHDSIGLGEDGPTHQPIEHLAMLRSIPNVNVFRPADSEETLACYELALKNNKTPSALILSRQNLKFVTKDTQDYDKGAYIVSECQNPDAVIIATGSELQIALDAKEILATKNLHVRVISMPCKEIFDIQEKDYQNKILGRDLDKKIIYCAIEAGVKQGWHEIIGDDGIFIGMNSFGASAPASDLFNHFAINSQKVVETILLAHAKNNVK
jgi:transketolase